MSREYEALLNALSEPLFVGDESLEDAREKLEAVHGHPIAEDVEVEWVELRGVRCAWVDTLSSSNEPHRGDADPNDQHGDANSQPTLILCHGGAYIAACGDAYLFYAEMLGRVCGTRVLLVDYRLAPEHRFPAALDDCVDAYRGLLESGHEPEAIGLIGDSCGGGLALSSLLQLRALGVPLPAFAVALGGWFDLEASGESATNPVGRDPFAARAFTRARGRDYVGPDGDLRDPLVSPIHADLSGLPPLLLQVGQIDLTRDDALQLAAHAGRQGVDVTVEIHPKMVHGFQGLASAGIPEAKAALARVASYTAARFAERRQARPEI